MIQSSFKLLKRSEILLFKQLTLKSIYYKIKRRNQLRFRLVLNKIKKKFRKDYLTEITTRLFLALPSGVSLSAIGFCSPCAILVILFAAMPLEIKYVLTAFALF